MGRAHPGKKLGDFDEKVLANTTVFRVDVESMTAKRKS
jgi:hypothetical protein